MKAKINNDGTKATPKEQPQSASIETVEQETDSETAELNSERFVVNKYGFNCANPNYKRTIEVEQEAFIAGANWQKHQSNQEVIALIEKRIRDIEGNGHTIITTEIVRELTDLLTQITR